MIAIATAEAALAATAGISQPVRQQIETQQLLQQRVKKEQLLQEQIVSCYRCYRSCSHSNSKISMFYGHGDSNSHCSSRPGGNRAASAKDARRADARCAQHSTPGRTNATPSMVYTSLRREPQSAMNRPLHCNCCRLKWIVSRPLQARINSVDSQLAQNVALAAAKEGGEAEARVLKDENSALNTQLADLWCEYSLLEGCRSDMEKALGNRTSKLVCYL